MVFATGVDSIAIGQTGVTDGNIPTGARIKSVTVLFSAVNLVAAACFITGSLQYAVSGQTFIDPQTPGGQPQRSNILKTIQKAAGLSQSVDITRTFKIPKKFQRIKEGMNWGFTWATNATVSAQVCVIYKVEL